ncbi:MAG: ABC transporter permease [Clostridia bacterium]|nr:ABC transporter permease [Clostridia bacterium]
MKIFTPDAPEYQSVDTSKLTLVQLDETIHDAKFEGKPIGFFKDAAIRFCRNKSSLVAFVIIAIMIILAIFGPSFNEYGYNDQYGANKNLPPKIPGICELGIFDGSRWLTNRRGDQLEDTTKYPEGCILKTRYAGTVKGIDMYDVKVDYYLYKGIEPGTYYWMGSDYLGRDMWTRLWKGSRISLIIAFVSTSCNVCIGLIYGSISGYYGGWTDMIMMRITEIINAMPQIVIVTLFMLFFGAGLTSIIFALLIQNWIGTARMIRTQFYRFKGYEYVLAARTLGVKDFALIFKHILPNSIGPIITRAMIAIPSAIFTESFLAYLGLGVQAPDTSIGILLSDGQKVLMQYPYQVWFPAIVISVLMIAFNQMANGLRDAFDPTQRGV